MNKSKKILKVLWDMFEDGLGYILAFTIIFVVLGLIYFLFLSPALAIGLIFGEDVGCMVAIGQCVLVLVLWFIVRVIKSFKRRMGRYE
mgnify:CR=1 FL=1